MTKKISLTAFDGHVVAGSFSCAKKNQGTALLVHGITADRHEWGFFDYLSEALLSKGINTLAIDYRGHGESTLSIDQLSLSGVFLDIMTGWQYVEQGSRGHNVKRFLVGNSFGGGAGLFIWANAQEC
jgi:pimeloyl-ACP methyl ester carboxylesterase